MARKVPVFLEPTKDRRIAVFGGGMVAYRKCRQFEGFDITVIADIIKAGADAVVAGNAVFKSENPENTIHQLKQ